MGGIRFDGVDFKDAHPGMREKCIIRGGKKLRLLEITPEFREVDWCERGHVGCVLDGDLEMTYEDRSETLHAGDGIFIVPRERHRAKALSPAAVLMLVEDV